MCLFHGRAGSELGVVGAFSICVFVVFLVVEVRGAVEGLGLKEAKELVEGAPVTLKKGLKEDVANEIKEKLEAAGANIELVAV